MTLYQNKSYHFMQIILHWVIALLVFYQFISGNIFSDNESILCKESSLIFSKHCVFFYRHYWVGLLILVFMIFRLVLRFYFGSPTLSDKVPIYIKFLAKVSHFMFYLLLIAMPVIGLLGFHFESLVILSLHNILANVLLILLLIHICAIGFHEGILGSRLFYRMASFNKKNKS